MSFSKLSRCLGRRGALAPLLALGLLLSPGPLQAAWGPLPTLWLSPAPSGKPGGVPAAGHDHGPPPPEPKNESAGKPAAAGKPAPRPATARGGAGIHAHGQSAGASTALLESEHQPKPRRSYRLNDRHCHGTLSAVVRRADGTVTPAELHGDQVSFAVAMGDGPDHGANNLYVTEQWLEPDNVLVVRVAKWITMHHNCGWGHDHKFDPQRVTPQTLATIPFEIVLTDLWDSNFHSRLRTGDELIITVLAQGKPAPNARVTVRTEQGWLKELITDTNGTASAQLIRDYYPRFWSEFKPSHRGPLLVTASYEAEQSGIFQEQPYNRVRYSGSLPWNYQPARQDFSSYIYGLLVTLVVLTVVGFGVWIYRERRTRPYRGVVFDE